MVILVTSKNEEDPPENEVARVFTTLYIDFSDAQGQLSPLIIFNYRQAVCARNDLGKPAFQSDSFLTHGVCISVPFSFPKW